MYITLNGMAPERLVSYVPPRVEKCVYYSLMKEGNTLQLYGKGPFR